MRRGRPYLRLEVGQNAFLGLHPFPKLAVELGLEREDKKRESDKRQTGRWKGWGRKEKGREGGGGG